jgi:DNA excision repair protein ERCC-2
MIEIDKNRTDYQVGVTDLVAFCLASGDLPGFSFAFSPVPDPIQIHQMIQASRGANYQKEVSISQSFNVLERTLLLSGRIDGVALNPGQPVVIEEIKTTEKKEWEILSQRNSSHWGQLRIYAYMYAMLHHQTEITLRLTYYSYHTRRTTQITENESVQALETFVLEILTEYVNWLKKIEQHHLVRDQALKNAVFPFSTFRKGQEQIVEAVQSNITGSGQLLLQAPTGLGKTMAVLFSTLKEMAEGKTRQIVFLSARTTGQAPLLAAVRQLREQGIPLKVGVISSKSKTCFCHMSEIPKEASSCELAKGFYDRLKEGRKAILSEAMITKELVDEYATRFQLCPFEYSLSLLPWMDIIICDYNYVFDPRVGLSSLVAGSLEQVLIVDEAHNLIDRSKDMYSAGICKSSFKLLKTDFRKTDRKLSSAIRKIHRTFVQLRREMKTLKENSRVATSFDETLLLLLEEFVLAARIHFSKSETHRHHRPLLDLYWQSADILRKVKNGSDGYALLLERQGKDLEVKWACLDPARMLGETLAEFKAVIFLSATLKPFDYFKRVIGCNTQARTLEIDSPFPSENLKIIIHRGISARFHDRTDTIEILNHAIVKFAQAVGGNVMVYFPSTSYLQLARSQFVSTYFTESLVVQKEAMSEVERIGFLAEFSKPQARCIGFALLGGIFGEAIDFPAGSLSGVVIVSLGLPGISKERELLADYFKTAGEDGYSFAFRFPGMNKVLQAVGRLIRRESDKGSALLLDDRFSQPINSCLFPAYWNVQWVRHSAQISSREFQHYSRSVSPTRLELFMISKYRSSCLSCLVLTPFFASPPRV